ncbi:hypothetical protein RhiirA1_466505 [Rhizophagus irregularis]|uniref:Serine-threonine/tyrosine-protein kinase catalytic domain-containing protein n=1 Tax=Rhizophagus irregularis TaxID=588596 RepID=A0A2N0RDX4_9GLOM|nr:hypothetical protein RhiirA1_466505 [Rhizophagus irregularis]
MKKCWDENPLKRPSSEEVLNIIEKWIVSPYNVKDINEELKYNIMELINAPIGHNNDLATESHPQAYYTSRLLGFTSKQLNEILESRDSQAYYSSQSTSGKVNEVLESEDSQANVKVNEMLVSKDLDDCIFNLKSLVQSNLVNLISGNEKIDDFVQEMQLKMDDYYDIVIFEWISYNQHNEIKEIGKESSITIYSAIWKDALLSM